MTDATAAADLPQADLAAFQRGEDRGMRAVYARYSGPVYAVAVSVLHDRELAADAVQETFLRAWRAASRYDPDKDIAPWLFTIARRVAVDIWRARRWIADRPPEDDAVVVLPPGLDTVWEAYQVRLAVDRLPLDEREVVRLYHFEQLSHPEIAARLGIPVGTVKSRSYRAHHRLADWLRPLCIEVTSSEVAASGAAYQPHSDPGARRDEP